MFKSTCEQRRCENTRSFRLLNFAVRFYLILRGSIMLLRSGNTILAIYAAISLSIIMMRFRFIHGSNTSERIMKHIYELYLRQYTQYRREWAWAWSQCFYRQKNEGGQILLLQISRKRVCQKTNCRSTMDNWLFSRLRSV